MNNFDLPIHVFYIVFYITYFPHPTSGLHCSLSSQPSLSRWILCWPETSPGIRPMSHDLWMRRKHPFRISPDHRGDILRQFGTQSCSVACIDFFFFFKGLTIRHQCWWPSQCSQLLCLYACSLPYAMTEKLPCPGIPVWVPTILSKQIPLLFHNYSLTECNLYDQYLSVSVFKFI